jgi:hypothetical protein
LEPFMSAADDDRLGREHAAFLASVLGRRVPEEPEERDASPEELALYLSRPDRELTAEDVGSWRSTGPPEDPKDEPEHEPSTVATTPADVADFFTALRRPRTG